MNDVKIKKPCKEKVKYEIQIEVYGVKICIKSNRKSFFEEIKKQLYKTIPVKFETVADQISEYIFYLNAVENNLYEFCVNDENLGKATKATILEVFDSKLRITIAEFAVSKVFLHAGVVEWKGKAIIIPANSLQGKTTLVTELVKKGALYYSDEYAVIDENGFVHPFPKMLSLRGIVDKHTQVDYAVETLGGRAGSERIPVGLFLLTGFELGWKPKRWKPKFLTAGQGILEIIPHVISIRNNTKFAIKTLNKVAKRAIIVKSKRGEAKEFADLLINFFETNVNYTSDLDC
ncbi:MAG: hypothetical protein LC768_16440 [Acidobacteria bacterium]|nr:hypothetical protein [Acidobacteriota bacterium]MCA1639888.1 hypothetical protein [Acidobacteriota bacterium]